MLLPISRFFQKPLFSKNRLKTADQPIQVRPLPAEAESNQSKFHLVQARLYCPAAARSFSHPPAKPANDRLREDANSH